MVNSMSQTQTFAADAPIIQLGDDFTPVVRVRGATGEITICQCSRCGELWQPRQTIPAKCPTCFSPLWNKPRVYKLEGAPLPDASIKAKPRGRAFAAGEDSRRVKRE